MPLTGAREPVRGSSIAFGALSLPLTGARERVRVSRGRAAASSLACRALSMPLTPSSWPLGASSLSPSPSSSWIAGESRAMTGEFRVVAGEFRVVAGEFRPVHRGVRRGRLRQSGGLTGEWTVCGGAERGGALFRAVPRDGGSVPARIGGTVGRMEARPDGSQPNPGLLQRSQSIMALRGYSPRTRAAYLSWIRRFIRLPSSPSSPGDGRAGGAGVPDLAAGGARSRRGRRRPRR